MKFPVAERTLAGRLAAGSPSAYTSLILEPAAYSIPDPAASPGPDTTSHAIHTVTTLPGCAARVSLDLTDPAVVKAPTPAKPPAVLLPCPTPPRNLPPLPSTSIDGRGLRHPPGFLVPAPVLPGSGAAAAAGGIGPGGKHPPAPQMHVQQPSHAQQDAAQQPVPHSLSGSQHAQPLPQERQQPKPGGPSGHRGSRPSVDAAAGAKMLATCPAAEGPAARYASASAPLADPPAFAFRGRSLASDPPMSLSSPLPTPPLRNAQSVPSALLTQAAEEATAAGAASAGPQAPYEWSFAENLQHARVVARYAAMDAADEIVYEPPRGGRGSDNDDDEDGGRARHRARLAWNALASLLGSSKVHKFGSGSGGGSSGGASPVTRAGTSGAGSRRGTEEGEGGGRGRAGRSTRSSRSGVASGSSGGGSAAEAEDGAGPEDEPLSKVVRSRDSTRLLRVHRSRVGIDRGGQRPPRPLAPAPSMARAGTPPEDPSDPVTAAMIAAAAAFAAATEAEAQRP